MSNDLEMPIPSLVATALLLVLVNLCAFRSSKGGTVILGLCVLGLIGPPLLRLVFAPLFWLSIFLPVGLIVWGLSERGPALFFRLSLAAAFVALAIPSVEGWRAEREFAVLRTLYPFESMEARVPVPKPASRPRRSDSPSMLGRLDRRERSSHDWNPRMNRLRRLHEDAVGLFIRNYGFGVGRMANPVPSESNLSLESVLKRIPQPGPFADLGSPGDWSQAGATVSEPMERLHEASLSGFLAPWTFGYVKDRQHVSGFSSHQFTSIPDMWHDPKLQTLDLIGILLHDEPVVYVSAYLPNMDELRQAPTRALNRVEELGLASLRQGEDFWVEQVGETTRMVGSIRSTKQCVACHGGQRGDLLGAFSYTLAR